MQWWREDQSCAKHLKSHHNGQNFTVPGKFSWLIIALSGDLIRANFGKNGQHAPVLLWSKSSEITSCYFSTEIIWTSTYLSPHVLHNIVNIQTIFTSFSSSETVICSLLWDSFGAKGQYIDTLKAFQDSTSLVHINSMIVERSNTCGTPQETSLRTKIVFWHVCCLVA